jgi:hypothetical protein
MQSLALRVCAGWTWASGPRSRCAWRPSQPSSPFGQGLRAGAAAYGGGPHYHRIGYRTPGHTAAVRHLAELCLEPEAEVGHAHFGRRYDAVRPPPCAWLDIASLLGMENMTQHARPMVRSLGLSPSQLSWVPKGQPRGKAGRTPTSLKAGPARCSLRDPAHCSPRLRWWLPLNVSSVVAVLPTTSDQAGSSFRASRV